MTKETLVLAAAALHNADNALNVARPHAPAEQIPDTIDAVQAHIRQALEAIAVEIGDDEMLNAC